MGSIARQDSDLYSRVGLDCATQTRQCRLASLRRKMRSERASSIPVVLLGSAAHNSHRVKRQERTEIQFVRPSGGVAALRKVGAAEKDGTEGGMRSSSGRPTEEDVTSPKSFLIELAVTCFDAPTFSSPR